MEKNKVIFGLVVILGLCSLGISGVFGLAQVVVPSISLDNGTGSGNASISVSNQSRLVYVWSGQNASNNTAIILGKDGRYVEFGAGERAYLVMGISPRWNQTVEMFVRSNTSAPFKIWGTIVPGCIWRDGCWVIDNSSQTNQDVILATVRPSKTE